MTMRVGQGYDVHAFDTVSADIPAEASIVLGGVEIPSDKPLLAHSDGDVLIHALCDALLGALALGDIGQHFPASDERYSDIDSRQLLRQVEQLVSGKGYRLLNADMTIVAQRPVMAPYIPAMRQNISTDLSVEYDAISVKATTTERLGFAGREEGIACYTTVLLQS